MTITTEIKCANCPTAVQRVFGADDDATARWLCPECDTDDDEIAAKAQAEEDAKIWATEEQMVRAELPIVPAADISYIKHLKEEDLWGDNFPDKKQAKDARDKPGEWFEDNPSLVAYPTAEEIAFTEKRLAKHGLGESQLHAQDVAPVVKLVLEDGELHGGIQDHQFDRRLSGASWHTDARDEMDGDDMTGFDAVRTKKHERLVPSWTHDDAKVKKVLLQLFPKQAMNAGQRKSAARWVSIIYLYFRLGQWVKTIAGSMGCSVRAVENIVHRARQIGEQEFSSVSSEQDSLRGDYWCCSELKAA